MCPVMPSLGIVNYVKCIVECSWLPVCLYYFFRLFHFTFSQLESKYFLCVPEFNLRKRKMIKITIILLTIVVSIQGHGYLQTPRSRNYVANQDAKDWGGGPNDPAIEYCPHCLNVVGK